MSDLWDVAVVGGGPAGLTAAIYASRAGLSVLVLEGLVPGGQAATTYQIENYPGFQNITGDQLAKEFTEHARASGAEILLEKAEKLELEGGIKAVRTAKNRYEAKTVILAQGARHRKLNVPGEDEFSGRGVSYCATCDGNFFRGKDVVVIGGGNTAVGDAVQLAKTCSHVTVIYHGDRFGAMPYLEKQMDGLPNITVLRRRETVEIRGNGKVGSVRVRNLETGDTEDVPAGGVFVSVGMQPNAELLEGRLKLAKGFVEAGENGVTSLPGVFVAGDLRAKELHQIVTALSDGANAAYSAQLYLQDQASS